MIISLAMILQDEKLGAQTTIHLAVSEEVADVSGMYYTDCKVRAL